MTAPFDSAKRPILTLGAAPGRLGNLSRPLQAARDADLLALDLDLRNVWFPPSSTSVLRHTTRIRSVWLPSAINGAFSQRRMVSLGEFLGRAKQEFGLRSLILPRNQDLAEKHTAIHNLAREIAARKTGADVRLVVGLRAGDFRHDRWHLDQLAGIRRMAEEWDLDLALDLTGNVSLAWEAEAAILRVFRRLTSVRLGQWRREDGSLVSSQTGQIAGRTLTMLADQGYAGVISVCSESRNNAASATIAAYQKQDILQRFSPDTIPSPAPQDTSISEIRRHL